MDGGKTWKNVLTISENTGVTDIALDPVNPDRLLAASYQRRRHQWTLIDGDPNRQFIKSDDAGNLLETDPRWIAGGRFRAHRPRLFPGPAALGVCQDRGG